MSNANLNIKINVNGDETAKELNKVSSSFNNLAPALEKLKKQATEMLAPYAMVKDAIKLVYNAYQQYREHINGLIDAYKDQWQAETSLQAVLKNTDKQLGLNIEDLTTLAKKYQECTTYSDETIMNIERMLVATKAINKVNMTSAVEQVLNISTAMGTDAVGSAKTLAEVLKKPADELNKLKSIGIDFTEQEKEKIKTLVESNQLFEAQKVVLDKVKDAYDGVATAMANTSLGKKQILENLKNENDQIKGQIASLEEEAELEYKIARQKAKNSSATDTVIYTAGADNPDMLRDMPLDSLKRYYETYKDMELSPYAEEKISIGNVKDAIKYQEAYKEYIGNYDKAMADGRLSFLNDDTNGSVGSAVENVEVKADVELLDDTKEKVQKELDKLDFALNITSASLDAVGDIWSAATDFATTKYDNEINALTSALDEMEEKWNDYWDELDDRQQRATESLVEEYALGRISAEEYYDAMNEMSQERTEAEEKEKEEKDKLQKQISDAEKKKFEAEKINSIAQAAINMASGIVAAWASGNPIVAAITSAAIATVGALQIATISQQQYTPSFASGAIVNKPTIAQIGDSGYPEAVIPLNRADDLGLSTKSTGDVYNIVVNVENAYTESDLYKTVYNGISQLQKDRVLENWKEIA